MEHHPLNLRKTLGRVNQLTGFGPDCRHLPQDGGPMCKNLSDMWIQSEFICKQDNSWLSNYPRTLGMFPCNKCQICLYVHRTSTFKDAHGNETYEIRDLINCSTSRVIYKITCPCPKIYVGKTKRQLRVRIGEHLGEIKDKSKIPEKPLAKHFAQYG